MPPTPPETAIHGASDLVAGLSSRPLRIPSKYFYDDRGSALFDAICDLPEYYPTRTEQALLDDLSDTIAGITQAQELVELGAGTARKTRHLIESLLDRRGSLHYAPLDISEYALAVAAESLSGEFPDLHVTGIQCDYTESLEALDPDPGCLAVFLGSTIGNFSPDRGVTLLKRLRARLARGDWFLLGLDLVKPVEVLEAAYNDALGITAEFNRNILSVVNQIARGDFNTEDFRHLAFFNPRESQIEMHLVAERNVQVRLPGLGLELEIDAEERILTEVSRKFTRASAEDLLARSGFRMAHWFESGDGYFGLALAEVAGEAPGP